MFALVLWFSDIQIPPDAEATPPPSAADRSSPSDPPGQGEVSFDLLDSLASAVRALAHASAFGSMTPKEDAKARDLLDEARRQIAVIERAHDALEAAQLVCLPICFVCLNIAAQVLFGSFGSWCSP